MATKVKIQMNDTEKILLKRSLNKNGQAQIKFTKECAKEMNNYTPFLTGRLKDMSVELKTDKIIFNAPYAKKQYYLNKGMGKQGTSLGGLRGKYWDKRMFADNGDKIVQTIADFVGGRRK
ncbi:TPA: capsid protein [Clostridium botulinum]|uniref:minor capsid protein n=1 Tax=Clostridium botulinum TaxID=1491 RepID=UPI0029B1D03A|nr:capsid protein [Clostridium botulinum]HDK7215629.1 capsid protein [Clostridium botulinum]HDK7231383.1 capsid protein [Clostridium botulinum]HDK7260741.1 capsid protein [Clostridium botulinum]HDK7355623.1 capsid protein [Clostridium botulinum]